MSLCRRVHTLHLRPAGGSTDPSCSLDTAVCTTTPLFAPPPHHHQGNPYLEEMKETAKYIARRGKGILAR